jgi:hypothetical protein
MIQMHFARDFAEMLRELSDAEVEFLVIPPKDDRFPHRLEGRG